LFLQKHRTKETLFLYAHLYIPLLTHHFFSFYSLDISLKSQKDKIMETNVIETSTGFGSDTIQKLGRLIIFLFHLFFQRKFIVHRLVGLTYLIQYALCFYWYFKK
jgi:hypothetical protein